MHTSIEGGKASVAPTALGLDRSTLVSTYPVYGALGIEVPPGLISFSVCSVSVLLPTVELICY